MNKQEEQEEKKWDSMSDWENNVVLSVQIIGIIV